MNDVMVIAEIGVNHNGSVDQAKRLVDAAKRAGADVAKFQTFRTDALVTGAAKRADYQKRCTGSDGGQRDMLRSLELEWEEFVELKRYCDRLGIAFATTTFDEESTRFAVETLDLPFIKIPSGEITNLPYLETVGSSGRPILLSTGMSTMDEVEAAVSVLRAEGADDLTVLHCTSEYPAPLEEVNLRAMVTMGEAFRVKIGYSDHTAGIDVPVAAVAMGATVIEKHFTLDRTMEGPDHRASLEPGAFARMVEAVRHVSRALGDGIKAPTLSEAKNVEVVRKSIVAKRGIAKGEVLCEGNITVKRPGTGISAMRWHDVLGTRATKSYERDEMIDL